MLQREPTKRLGIQQIREHKWVLSYPTVLPYIWRILFYTLNGPL